MFTGKNQECGFDIYFVPLFERSDFFNTCVVPFVAKLVEQRACRLALLIDRQA